jgi:hypothetical protein
VSADLEPDLATFRWIADAPIAPSPIAMLRDLQGIAQFVTATGRDQWIDEGPPSRRPRGRHLAPRIALSRSTDEITD